VGIDRPDEGDTPDRVPERHAGMDAAPLLDPEVRAAEHARYRAAVEQAYTATGDTLAEELPGLRSAWKSTKSDIPNGPGRLPAPKPTAPGWPA